MMQFKKSLQNQMKKMTAFALVTAIVSADLCFIHTENAYAASLNMGVENHWAEPFMQNLYNRGLMSGDKYGNMNPDKPITRKTPFADIKGTEWYADDIAIAYNQGYFAGDGSKSANPQGKLTREQAVSLLGRNLKIEEIPGENGNFMDSKSIANWSRGYVNTATDKGYISGYKNKTFRPQNYITRAEVAKVLSDAVGELVSSSGTKYLGYQEGNVTIASSGVTLKDTVIKGDLYITEGIGLGHTYFENVHVLGDVIVSGTGESYAGKSSITFHDSTISNLILEGTSKNLKSIKLSGNTIVDTTKVKSSAFLEELSSRGGGFKNVILDGPEKTALHVSGLFDQVTVKGPKNALYLDKETIKKLIVDEEAVDSKVFLDEDTYVDGMYLDVGIEVSGQGEIDYLKVNAPGSEVAMLPDEIEIRPGLTGNINGKDMTSKDAEEESEEPRILSDYPETEDIGPKDAVAKFKTNKPGTLYWTVTYYEDGRPSEDEIIKPGKYNTEIKKEGSLKVEAQTDHTVKITGLEMESDYILSAILVDDRDDRSDRETDYFTTLNNTKAGFLSGFPRVKDVADVSATLEFVANKDSDLYWAVYEKGHPAPDSRALRSQKLYGSVAKGVKEECNRYEGDTLQVSGLEELNSYDCYFLLSDGSNDSSVAKLQFTTKDATPPQFNLGYPKITSSEKTTAEVGVSLNEDGIVYYAIYFGGTPFPVQEQLDIAPPAITSDDAKQQIIKGKGAEKTGKSSNLKAETPSNIKFSGLKPEEEYDVYFVAEDKSGNLSEIKKTTIEAKPDFLEDYPEIRTIQNFSADVAINVTKDCKAYWAVLPSGSVAPNQNSLKLQTMSGATNNGIIEECKKNEELILTVDSLREYTKYDFYVLVSDGITDSDVVKVEFQTADLSAPVFANGYPALDKVGDKSIDVKFKVNEAGTIHYVLCEKSDTFPLPVPPSTDEPALDSDEAKNQVVLGNSGIKSGKVTAKQNVEGKISLTGLEPETPYDLFIVAKDVFDNISNVVYMDVKTADFTDPTAELEFEETISGDVVAGSAIRIKFSEEVVDNATKKKLSTIENKDDLKLNITLYDLSALRRPTIDIDFTYVRVEDIDGKTVVTFPEGTLNLNSGNAYEFELNKIADTSGNRMDERTLLPSFNTVAPMVEILETVSEVEMDMSFELTPQISETNDNVFYDVVFQSSEKVGFEVYEKPFGSTNFTKVTSSSTPPESVVIVEKDKSVSLRNIKDKILKNQATYDYEKFKELKQTEYGIKIVSINGELDRSGWDKTVNFGVKCIIGSYSGLSPVSDNPTDRLSEAISEGKVTVVNYPKDFNVKVYFTDTIVPAFAKYIDGNGITKDYPKLVNSDGTSLVGDTIIRPLVKTTKKATFYYLIAREGTVTNPTADGIMDGKYKPQDGVYGSFNVASGQTEYEYKIEGLKPRVKYVMYCFLKGTPAATSTPMRVIEFTTRDVAAPILDSAYVRDRLENSAIIDIAFDKEAEIDWIVYNNTSQPDVFDDPDGTNDEQKAYYIRNKGEEVGHTPIDFNSKTATISQGDTLAKASITINNLERNVYYNFYAVAKSPIGGSDSKIIKVAGITPADVSSPTVEVDTVIKNPTSDGQPYDGEVKLTFSEPMYYIPYEGQGLERLTITIFQEKLNEGILDGGDGDESRTTYKAIRYSAETVGEEADGTKIKALKSVTIEFDNVYNNSSIDIPLVLSDENTNIAGSLYMTFVEMSDRADSYWQNEFIK